MIDISVIIPVYNSEDKLSRCLESILNQSKTNFEIILIDDGSTDSSSLIYSRMSEADSRIKYTYKKNGGVSSARNLGLKLSSGEYITFLDSDDTYEKQFLEKMYYEISCTGSEVVYSGHTIKQKDGKDILSNTKYTNKKVLENYLKGKTRIHTNSWLIKNELINNHQLSFEEGLQWGEDIIFFSRVLSLANHISFVKENLTNYYADYGDNQLSSFNIDKIELDIKSMDLLQEYLTLYDENKASKIVKYYRLPALITYRLISYISDIENLGTAKDLYYKTYDDNSKFMFINGVRSLKLKVAQLKLRKILR